MIHRRFVLLGIVGVVGLVLALTLTGLGENLTYYLYPTEAVEQKANFPDGNRFRLAGLIVLHRAAAGEAAEHGIAGLPREGRVVVIEQADNIARRV